MKDVKNLRMKVFNKKIAARGKNKIKYKNLYKEYRK